jgi:hypothetical protein
MADLTSAERERLIKLNEELSECIEQMGFLIQAMGKASQTVCKTLIHGYTATFEDVDYDNRKDLMREIGDVESIVDLMVLNGDLDRVKIDGYRIDKKSKLARFLKHQ